MTGHDRCRVERERLDLRCAGTVAERDVRRKRAETGFQPEAAYPEHVADAAALLIEGLFPAVWPFQAPQCVHELLMKIEEFGRSLGSQPQRVAALAAALAGLILVLLLFLSPLVVQ